MKKNGEQPAKVNTPEEQLPNARVRSNLRNYPDQSSDNPLLVKKGKAWLKHVQ